MYIYIFRYTFLKLLTVLLVSVTTIERSFSNLRRLKIYLRNRTSETRLNNLALLFIHKDICVSNEELLNKFTSVSRNLDFVLQIFFSLQPTQCN